MEDRGYSDTAMATKHGSIGDRLGRRKRGLGVVRRASRAVLRRGRSSGLCSKVRASTTPKWQEEGTLGGKRRADCKIAAEEGCGERATNSRRRADKTVHRRDWFRLRGEECSICANVLVYVC